MRPQLEEDIGSKTEESLQKADFIQGVLRPQLQADIAESRYQKQEPSKLYFPLREMD